MSMTSTRTRVRPHHLFPERSAWVDIAFVLLLGATVLSALAPSFSDWSFLVVGVIGVLLGVVVTHFSKALGWPVVAPAVLLLVGFFVVGGPLALRSMGNTAFLPSGSTLSALADQAIFGWKDFLTTLPPVDGDGPLLVLPLILGLAIGFIGIVTSHNRLRQPWFSAFAPILAMGVALAGVILLGVREPASLLVQGGLFAALSLGWLALRSRRMTAVVHGGSSGWGRLAVGTALVLTAAGVAFPASALLDRGDTGRTVARNWVEPPFEIGRYPSPLAGFRKYIDLKGNERPGNVYDETLFTMSGLEAGTLVRLASLDTYDGMVWGASDDPLPGEGGDSFQRVSSTIHNPVKGDEVSATVTVGKGFSGVWLPTVGALQEMHFEFGDTRDKQETFRYNLATSTAVVPTGVHPGDVYSFVAIEPDTSLAKGTLAAVAQSLPPEGTEFLDAAVDQWTEQQTTDMGRLMAVAEHLRTEGRYSDGVVKSERQYHAGHGLKRLNQEFIAQEMMVGNGEQYAAVVALLAQKLGLQARVVLGAVLPEDGVVRGKDVRAWIEVRAADGSWRTLATETFLPTKPPSEQMPQTNEPMTGTVVPPPNPIPPPSTAGDLSDAELKKRKVEAGDEEADGFTIPAWVWGVAKYVGLPIVILMLIFAAIAGLKFARRSRRRNAESPSARFVGGWRELVDHARDLGQPVPLGAGVTRREQAAGIVADSAPLLARRADNSVFGPTPPEPDAAAEFWTSVEQERRSMSASVPWHRKLRATLNLTTFAPSRLRVRRTEPRPDAGPEESAATPAVPAAQAKPKPGRRKR